MVGAAAAGCTAAQPLRFVVGADSGPVEVATEKRQDRPPLDRRAIDDAVARAVVERAATPSAQARSVESSDPELKSALALLSQEPTGAAHRRVAWAYFALGVLDRAQDHFVAALRVNPRDASAYDGRARVWREWGLYAMGLADAARAVYFAPQAPWAENTRGTLLEAIGDTCGALRAYTRAAALEPTATYPRQNIASMRQAGRHCGDAPATTKRPPGGGRQVSVE
jgi:tetratricopeptide (TPR) repeat protein